MTDAELEVIFIGFAIAGAGVLFAGAMVALARWIDRHRG